MSPRSPAPTVPIVACGRPSSPAPTVPIVACGRPSVALAAAAVAALLVALLWPGPAHAAWRPPVAGPVARPFDPGSSPFEAGRHRGIDLEAVPGAPVRAPCSGTVAFAGQVGSTGRVVTLRCGVWRVSHMPLARIAVRSGAAVGRGALIGTVAAGRDHRGLHVGVRRDATRFGYVDPLRFLAAGRGAPPPLGRAPRAGRQPPRMPRAPRAVRTPPAANRPAPATGSNRATAGANGAPAGANGAPAGSNRGVRAPFAPWPAWLGLALVLGGAGVRLRGRRLAARGRVAAAGTLTR